MSQSCFATCPRGIEDLLAAELGSFGALNCRNTVAGVSFEADLETLYRSCLWSRTANRILLKIGDADARTTDELYQAALNIPWQDHMNVSSTFAVHVNLRKTAIDHSHFAALRIKDAIVDLFTQKVGSRPSISTETPDLQITAFIERDRATFYLDLSGDSLHQRGYRLRGSSAPLKENLAAALLLRANWPALAATGNAFVDVMCGSGTLPVEAALIASDTAPALNRSYFGFLGWLGHNPAIWERLLAEATYRAEQGQSKMPVLLGFDRNRKALEAARENAKRAGMLDHIQFAYQDLFEFNHDFPSQGLMLSNPPYGQRLGGAEDLQALYKQIGRVLKTHFVGWLAGIYAADQDLVKLTGLRSHKMHSLANGTIECKLYHFEVDPNNYFSDSRLPRPLRAEQLSPQADMLANRLQKNSRQLRRWREREGITCYRIYDADLPEFSFAVDVYGSENTIRFHVQEYEAPADIDRDKARMRVREMLTVVYNVFETDQANVFLKTRRRQRGEAQYEQQDQVGEFNQVSEGGCKLLVNLSDYLDTGLFLDHRPLRLRIQAESQGKKFLNLFCYTATATVHAVQGGAEQSDSVDMSNTYLDWAGRNFSENGIDQTNHRLLQADCLQWLQQAQDSYDLILLDPPAFSNSKRMKDAFDIQREHKALIHQTMTLLAPGGTLYFSTNFRRFKLDESLASEFHIKDISKATIPQDFARRPNIHYCWQITHQI